MAIIQVLDVSAPAVDSERLWDCAIDAPVTGSQSQIYAMKIEGWLLSRGARSAWVEAVHEDRVIRRTPVRVPRPKVCARYPNVAGAENCGFWMSVGVLGMPTEFEILLQAVLDDQSPIPLARIRVRHCRLTSGFTPKLQPLMITSLGRTGTTWLMRLLAEHPQIVAYRRYPYELRTARYWMHMLKILSEPANHFQSSHPDTFQKNHYYLGHNPFYSRSIADGQRLGRWFGRTYVEQLAAFCQQSVEACYLQIAASQDQTRPAYFVEKHVPGHIPWLLWELYPQAREVFLIRDFRDMVSSMLAFNAKRGYDSFGRESATSDEDFIRQLHDRVARLQQAWKQRSRSAHLLRYEDLILSPVEILSSLLDYLGLESSQAMAQSMIEKASEESPQLKQHQTSSDPTASVGRWRRDLDPALQANCQEAFGSFLETFGYPEGGFQGSSPKIPEIVTATLPSEASLSVVRKGDDSTVKSMVACLGFSNEPRIDKSATKFCVGEP